MRISFPHVKKLTEIALPLKQIVFLKENSKFVGWKTTNLKVVGIWNFQDKNCNM